MIQSDFLNVRRIYTPSTPALWGRNHQAWTYKGIAPPSLLVPLYNFQNEHIANGAMIQYATSRAILFSYLSPREDNLIGVLYSKIDGKWTLSHRIFAEADFRRMEILPGNGYFMVSCTYLFDRYTERYNHRVYRWDGAFLWEKDVLSLDESCVFGFSKYTDALFCSRSTRSFQRIDPETGGVMKTLQGDFTRLTDGGFQVFQRYIIISVYYSGAGDQAVMLDFDLNMYPALSSNIGNNHLLWGSTSTEYYRIDNGACELVRTITRGDFPPQLSKYDGYSYGFYTPIPFVNDDLLVYFSVASSRVIGFRLGVNNASGPLDYIGSWDGLFYKYSNVLQSFDGITWIAPNYTATEDYTVYADLTYVNDQYLSEHPEVAARL